MMKNRHLSKVVQNKDFFGLENSLDTKCNDKGIQLIVADQFYPSSKLAAAVESKKISYQPGFIDECGNMADRDFQASIKSQGLWRTICKLTLKRVNANMYGYVSPGIYAYGEHVELVSR